MAANANEKSVKLSATELNHLYTQARQRFAQVSTWREYIELAEEFHALDTYKDSPQLYAKCIKAASAPAYREITEHIATAESVTADEYREAARVMQTIQSYEDAREVMRVYTIKANVLTYEEAVELVSNADATTEELGRGVEMLRSIKTFRNSRDLLERFEKYYFDRMYAEGTHLMQTGHVYSEFEEAAGIFEKISAYSDAAEQAAACRKRAAKLKPKSKKSGASEVKAAMADETARVERNKPRGTTEEETAAVKPRHRVIDDETHNTVLEVWRTIDKRRMVSFIIWLFIFVANLCASIYLPSLDHEFFRKYANEIRGVTTIIAIVSVIMGARAFVRMLTASMRQRLGRAALRTLQKLIAPLVKAMNNLLMSIGIDLSRRGRLGGRDEKTFVFDDTEKVKKPRHRLKNDLKWVEQTDNSARVRFIFIDYMIRRMKSGYFMKRFMTPAEIGRELAVEEDEQLLFTVYDKARYGGADAVDEITDAMVNELKLVNQKRNS